MDEELTEKSEEEPEEELEEPKPLLEKKVSDKEMLEKIVSIPANTLNYANRSYNRFRKWG